MKKKIFGLLIIATMAMPNVNAELHPKPKRIVAVAALLASVAGITASSIALHKNIKNNVKTGNVDYKAIAKQIASTDVINGLKRLAKKDPLTCGMVAIELASIIILVPSGVVLLAEIGAFIINTVITKRGGINKGGGDGGDGKIKNYAKYFFF